MSTTTPDRYRTQRSQALGRANEIRLARAALKHRIADGEISAVAVILTVPPETESWEIGALLVSQHRWGVTRTRRLLQRQEIVETKPLGELTQRQRRVLAAALSRDGALEETAALEGGGQRV